MGVEPQFQLEALEPRLLLSADGLNGGAPVNTGHPVGPDPLFPAAVEVFEAIPSSVLPSADQRVDDIFDGLRGNGADDPTAVPGNDPAPTPAEHQDSDLPGAREQQKAEASNLPISSDRSGGSNDAAPGELSADVDPISGQLVETLRAANGPPASDNFDRSPLFAAAASPALFSGLLETIESKLNDYANDVIGGERSF